MRDNWSRYQQTGAEVVGVNTDYRRIDDHTLELTAKKAGNVVTSGFIVISADGTSRTAIVMRSDPSGKKVPFMAVYNKQ